MRVAIRIKPSMGVKWRLPELNSVPTIFTELEEWRYPVSFVYTFTETAFQESFVSGFSQWGDVVKGDELPYVPEHQLAV